MLLNYFFHRLPLAVRLKADTTDRQRNEIINEGTNNIDSNFRTCVFGFSRDTNFGFYEKEQETKTNSFTIIFCIYLFDSLDRF